MHWKLNATPVFAAGRIILYGKTSYVITPGTERRRIASFIEECDQGLSAARLHSHASVSVLGALIGKLIRTGLLVRYRTRYQDSPLEKSYDFFCHYLADARHCPDFDPDTHLTILGLGGVGANVALNLLLSGFTRFTLVDFDRVGASNLNRQYGYLPADIGQPKTRCLAERMRQLNPRSHIRCIEHRVRSAAALHAILPRSDMVISGIDTPPARAACIVATYALESGTPVLFGSTAHDSIKAGPLLVGRDAACRYLVRFAPLRGVRSKPLSGSLPSTNSLLCAIMSNEVINYFYHLRRNLCLNRELTLDPFNLSTLGEYCYENGTDQRLDF
ncbi:ThiF family adenylyltransferase [Paludibacterium yongneupense]|uniref:ThiF family adenylyltransferase n=1 Tax=Paludibacterium yongneupense TaxID=400061 RepID=UPI000417E552|nr:ThiF family adenylyltransferase [Paludibacterium yongneupense]